MKTVFRVEIVYRDFLNEFRNMSNNSFICPKGFDSINQFARFCKNENKKKNGSKSTKVSFEFDEPMWFNLGDVVILNNVYYKVIGKTLFANENTINYKLI